MSQNESIPPVLPSWQPPRRTVCPSGFVRVLSGIVALMVGAPSPVTGLMAITMFLSVIGSDSYVGGVTGILLFFSFAGAPIVAFSHFFVAIGVTSLRVSRWIWVISCIYLSLVWMAITLGSIHGQSAASGTQTWFPFFTYIGVFSLIVGSGTFAVVRQSDTPAGLPFSL